MEILSERYGWTPNQIREQRAEDIQAYVQIIQTRNRIESAKLKKNGKSRP